MASISPFLIAPLPVNAYTLTYLRTFFLVFSVVVKIRVCLGLRLRRCVFVELRVGLRLRVGFLGHRMSDLIAVCL